MSRRKNALSQAFIEAGLGEPPFGSSHLHSYDEKLKEVQFSVTRDRCTGLTIYSTVC